MTETLRFEHTFPVAAEELYEWHARPGAFGRLAPPWQKITLDRPAGEIRDGSRVSFRLAKGPLSLRWVAEHRDVQPGSGFTDVQIEGPFSSWTHRHDFLPNGGGSSVLRDALEYELPGGRLGRVVAGSAIRRDIRRTFGYRQRVLAADLREHAAHADRRRLTVAITGASGLVGTALADFLSTGGHRIIRISRSGGDGSVRWDPATGELELARLEGLDAIVHLAGENIAAARWSERQKGRIRGSRVVGTRGLIESLARLSEPPATLVSASAIGFYGDRGERAVSEEDGPGDGFLAETCVEWEAEAVRAERLLGARVVRARFGIVLSPRAGALAKMLPVFRLGAGGRIGNGRQMMSWVALDDVVGALHHILMDTELAGPCNVTAPGAESNAGFARTLGGVLRRPAMAPLPAPLARIAFGEMADEMLLSGARVLPARLEATGYAFRYPTLESALRHVLGRS